MNDEASYICDSCGEEIVVPLDLTAGASQEYVEDCPVCCCPNVVHVEIDEQGEARIGAEAESRPGRVLVVLPPVRPFRNPSSKS